MKNWILNFSLLAGIFCAHGSPAQVTPNFVGANASGMTTPVLSAEENHFFETINQFRVQLNLPLLQIQWNLQNAAQKFSAWLAMTDLLTHYGPTNQETPFQRMEVEGYGNFTDAGENIACGNGDAIATFRQFAFSPGHLENMLNPHYHHFGISRSGNGSENCPFYWVNDFGSTSDDSLDPAEVTDLNLITQAVIQVAGPLNGKVVALPTAAPTAFQNTSGKIQ